MIVPFPAGGTTDVVGRVVAERMSKYLARPIIVENVGGAEGSIGLGRVAHARPDGYMIGLGGSSTHVFDAAFYSRPYDVLNDFAAIAPLAATPGVLFARKPLPANNLSELIAWLKANPNRASAGIYSGSSHLVTAFFQKETGAQFILVPFRGEAPATQDLVAAEGHYRHTQCSGRGCTGRFGGAIPVHPSWAEHFSTRATDRRGAERDAKERCREMVAAHQGVWDQGKSGAPSSPGAPSSVTASGQLPPPNHVSDGGTFRLKRPCGLVPKIAPNTARGT
jgi:hypothetical protein